MVLIYILFFSDMLTKMFSGRIICFMIRISELLLFLI